MRDEEACRQKYDRWREIYNLNRGVIGPSPNDLKVGTVLRLPAKGPQAEVRRDSDGDGVIDKYDLTPDDAQDKRWNLAAARAYGEFAKRRARELQKQGVEVDCADLAVKLLEGFCQEAGLPSLLAEHGKWSVYSPENAGGLPNVNGPNWVRTELGGARSREGEGDPISVAGACRNNGASVTFCPQDASDRSTAPFARSPAMQDGIGLSDGEGEGDVNNYGHVNGHVNGHAGAFPDRLLAGS